MSLQPMKRLRSAALVTSISIALPGFAVAADLPVTIPFQSHAGFFSKETKQATPIDPQVFVRAPGTPAGTGPQGIHHAAGYRPAPLSDAPGTSLYNADGKPLGFTLGAWLGASGQTAITRLPQGGAEVTARFAGLRPSGVYSLFENHFDRRPVGFTPLDGSGKSNSFSAKPNGTAEISVRVPAVPTNANAVLLVYHSDGRTYGSSRGQPGVAAHHQLIAPVP